MDYINGKKLFDDITPYCEDKENCPGSSLESCSKTLFGNTDDNKESVNHPSHYQGKHECIDEMRALFGDEAVKAFCRCNIWKYTYRADSKNGEEDRKKAEWYMDYLMNMENMKSNKSLLG